MTTNDDQIIKMLQELTDSRGDQAKQSEAMRAEIMRLADEMARFRHLIDGRNGRQGIGERVLLVEEWIANARWIVGAVAVAVIGLIAKVIYEAISIVNNKL